MRSSRYRYRTSLWWPPHSWSKPGCCQCQSMHDKDSQGCSFIIRTHSHYQSIHDKDSRGRSFIVCTHTHGPLRPVVGPINQINGVVVLLTTTRWSKKGDKREETPSKQALKVSCFSLLPRSYSLCEVCLKRLPCHVTAEFIARGFSCRIPPLQSTVIIFTLHKGTKRWGLSIV